jgi:hypothetical protein
LPAAQRQSEAALAAFAGDGLDPDAGLVPPPSGSQQVQWARVVQQRDPRPGEHVYTVATQPDRAGLVYLAVDVRRDRDATLRLGGYPALVGPPASAPANAEPDAGLREVGDAELQATVARALRNYLAGDADQLAADLAAGARVTLPDRSMRMSGVDELKWAPGRGCSRRDGRCDRNRGGALDAALRARRRAARRPLGDLRDRSQQSRSKSAVAED